MIAIPARARHMHLCLQHSKRHAHIGRMHGNAGLAGAEDSVHAVVAADRGATVARLAFVAGRGDVVEVGASRALQKVAADRCHIAQLLGCAGHDGAREHRIALLYQRMIGKVGVAHESADAEPAARRSPPPCPEEAWRHRSASAGRSTSIFIRSTRLVPPAMNLAPGTRGHLAHSVRDVAGARILETDHDCCLHRLLYGCDNVRIGAAAADVAAHELADFVRRLRPGPRRSGPRPSRFVPACSSHIGTRRDR